MSIFSILNQYIKYRKIVNKNKIFFLRNHNLRVDRIYRLYTTVSVSEDKQKEIKERNYLKSEYEKFDNDNYLNDKVSKYLADLSDDLQSIGVLNNLKDPIVDRVDIVNIDILYNIDKFNPIKTIWYLRMMWMLFLILIVPVYFMIPLYIIIPCGLVLLVFIMNKIIFNKFIM